MRTGQTEGQQEKQGGRGGFGRSGHLFVPRRFTPCADYLPRILIRTLSGDLKAHYWSRLGSSQDLSESRLLERGSNPVPEKRIGHLLHCGVDRITFHHLRTLGCSKIHRGSEQLRGDSRSPVGFLYKETRD